tara:strand:+ start:766 stop:1203 length:438 start_codon:yes stop_codon:yes gene_type:complete
MALTPEEEELLEMINSREGGKKLSPSQKAVLLRQAKLQGSGFEKFDPNDISVPMPEFKGSGDPVIPMERDIPETFLDIRPEGGLKPLRENEPVPPPRDLPPRGMKRGGYDPKKPLPDATIPPLKKSGGGSVDVDPGPTKMGTKKK